MTYPLSGGDITMVITLDDIRSHIITKTLADEPIARGGLVLQDIAANRVAWSWDVKPDDVNLTAFSSTQIEPFAWQVRFLCSVTCRWCDRVATHQTDFSSNLCELHLQEAWAEDVADLHNDDRAIGLAP